jgi:hypothetical protein
VAREGTGCVSIRHQAQTKEHRLQPAQQCTPHNISCCLHMCPHLQRNEVQDGADAALPSRLPVCCEQLQVLVLPELHLDLHAAAAAAPAAPAASRHSGDATIYGITKNTFVQCRCRPTQQKCTLRAYMHGPKLYSLSPARCVRRRPTCSFTSVVSDSQNTTHTHTHKCVYVGSALTCMLNLSQL